MTKAGAATYAYDAADNPTLIPGSTNTYDAASQLEKGTGLTYAYDELGERTKRTPTAPAATSYGYDQAGELTSVTRPKEGEVPAIEDSYRYDGNGLRTAETVGANTNYLAWDATSNPTQLLNDGSNSYVYGVDDAPVEQISGAGTVLYLHHDYQRSTRVLSGASGTAEGTYTFDAYGNTAGHTGTASTPLGFDGQYTSADTGLIYLRARTYDPSTAQFVSRDPLEVIGSERYTFAEDNPVSAWDPSGLRSIFDEVLGTVTEVPNTIESGAAWNYFENEVLGTVHKVTFGAADELLGINPACAGAGFDFGNDVLGNLVLGGGAIRAVGEVGELAATRTAIGARLFGRLRAQGVEGVLNSNNDIRLGMGWRLSDQRELFRLSIGGRKSDLPFHGHIDFLK